MLSVQDERGRTEFLAELHAGLRRRIPALRALQCDLGRRLLAVRRTGCFPFHGATTFPLYCEGLGLSPSEGRELVAMVEAALTDPGAGRRILEGSLSPQKAALLNEVHRRAELQRPGEDFLARALASSAQDLLDEVRRRREEARLGEPAVALTLQVSRGARDHFLRCRQLVSRRAGHLASEGETLASLTDGFLDRQDPERKALRLRGRDERDPAPPLPPPAGERRSRHIPERTTRDLLRVAGDRCWVEGCGSRVFLERAHRRPHRWNGSSGAENLLLLCSLHHLQHDRGDWILRRGADGGRLLIDRRGVPAGRLRGDAARFLAAVDPCASRGAATPSSGSPSPSGRRRGPCR